MQACLFFLLLNFFNGVTKLVMYSTLTLIDLRETSCKAWSWIIEVANRPWAWSNQQVSLLVLVILITNYICKEIDRKTKSFYFRYKKINQSCWFESRLQRSVAEGSKSRRLQTWSRLRGYRNNWKMNGCQCASAIH